MVYIQDEPAPDNQLDLFAGDPRERWYSETIEIAKTIRGPFWFGELRARCGKEPDHVNMWGQLAKIMLHHGFRMTGRFRRSKTESRRGSMEFEWSLCK